MFLLFASSGVLSDGFYWQSIELIFTALESFYYIAKVRAWCAGQAGQRPDSALSNERLCRAPSHVPLVSVYLSLPAPQRILQTGFEQKQSWVR